MQEKDGSEEVIKRRGNRMFISYQLPTEERIWVKEEFGRFRDANPEHPLLQYCLVKSPAQSGWKSDVLVRILRCDISKEDFLAFARLVVNPNVGNEDFKYFEFQNESIVS